jgi:hypothetical protein
MLFVDVTSCAQPERLSYQVWTGFLCDERQASAPALPIRFHSAWASRYRIERCPVAVRRFLDGFKASRSFRDMEASFPEP